MGPDRVSQMCDLPASKPVYDSADAFLADVVAVQSRMVGELVEAGCPYVQLDEPSYTGYVDRATLERMRARGEDPMANLRRAIAASNAVIAGHAGKAVFGIHICRGNRASMWHREGTYDGIAEELFSTLRFDRLLLEYDTARAGGFEPLRFVPKGAIGQAPIVVLGLVTTKTGEVETVDALLRRIEEASRFIDVGQLALSPQCGFASGLSGNDLSHDQQWRKLEVILETAGASGTDVAVQAFARQQVVWRLPARQRSDSAKPRIDGRMNSWPGRNRSRAWGRTGKPSRRCRRSSVDRRWRMPDPAGGRSGCRGSHRGAGAGRRAPRHRVKP